MLILRKLVLAFVISLLAGPAFAAGKVALVIGNGKYEHANPLPNPANDASDMASLLATMGFTVISGTDLDRVAMGEKIGAFEDAARDADVTLFFYAGHGLQVNGRNYLVPVNAKLERESSLQFEAIDADTVLRGMAGPGKAAIALLDACRDNPLAQVLARSMAKSRSGGLAKGLAAPNVPGGGILIGFATSPEDVAADGDGRNSPFTTALLKHLAEPGVEIQQVMTRVKRDVYASTKQDQEPWHNTSLRDEIYLGGEPQQASPPPVADTAAAEWEAVKDTDSREVLTAFAEKHAGNAVFAALARARIKAIMEKDLALLDSLVVPKKAPPAEDTAKTDILDSLKIPDTPPPDKTPGKRSGRSWTLAQFLDSAKSANAGQTTYALLGPPKVEPGKPAKNPGNKVKALDLNYVTEAPSLDALLQTDASLTFDIAQSTTCRLDFVDRCPHLPQAMVSALQAAFTEAGLDMSNHEGDYYMLTPIRGSDRFLLSNSPAFRQGEVALIAAIVTPEGAVEDIYGFDLGTKALGVMAGSADSLVEVTGALADGDDLILSFDSGSRCTLAPRRFGFITRFSRDSRKVAWTSPTTVSDANLLLDNGRLYSANGGSCIDDYLYQIDAATGQVQARVKLSSGLERMDLQPGRLLLELADKAEIYDAP